MKVNIEELQNVVILLLSKLKETQGDEIEIKNDYDWDFSDEEIYDPYKDPKTFTIGQLSDDLLEIHRISRSSDDALPYDLKRVANILTTISIEYSSGFWSKLPAVALLFNAAQALLLPVCSP